jgi:predicted RNA binding protein YcfA (HicA-like mRNA interferase family)
MDCAGRDFAQRRDAAIILVKGSVRPCSCLLRPAARSGHRLLVGSDYPSLKPAQLLKRLREIGFEVEPESKGGGSHVWVSNGEIRLRWAFHKGATISPGLVKKILTRDIGLTDDEAKELLS